MSRCAVLASRVSRLQNVVTKWDLDLEMLGWDLSMRKTQRRSRLGLAVGKNSNFTNTIDLRKKTMGLVEDVTVIETPENRVQMMGRDVQS